MKGPALWAAGYAWGTGAAAMGSLYKAAHLVAAWVLQSSRALAADAWLAVWAAYPAWGVLGALAASAAFAWEAVQVSQKRQRSRRALAAALAVCAAVGGAARLWSPASWGAVLALAVLATAIGGRLSATLSQWAADAQALATGGEAPQRLEAGSSAGGAALALFDTAQAALVKITAVVATLWALGSLAPPLIDGAGVRWLELAAAGGMGASLVCGLLYLASLRQLVLKAQFEEAGVEIGPGYWLTPPKRLGAVLLGVVLVATLLPSDVSPLHIRNFNRWMESFTEWVGPLFVPSARARRIESGGGLVERIAERFADGLLLLLTWMQGRGPLQRVVQIALFTAVAMGIWRLYYRDRKPLRPSRGVGTLPLGVGWLWAEIQRMARRLLAWLGIRVGIMERGQETAQLLGEGGGARRPRVGLARLPADVIEIYLHVLDRLAQRGFPRIASETPLEYLARWEQRSAAPSPSGFSVLTRLFLDVRYGGKAPGPRAVEEARRAASATLRIWRRTGWARRLRFWLGRERKEP